MSVCSSVRLGNQVNLGKNLKYLMKSDIIQSADSGERYQGHHATLFH